jgi:hypothetical protein
MSEHGVLLAVMLITLVTATGGLLILGSMLRESQKMALEAQRITRAVGLLVIQETAKLPGKASS